MKPLPQSRLAFRPVPDVLKQPMPASMQTAAHLLLGEIEQNMKDAAELMNGEPKPWARDIPLNEVYLSDEVLNRATSCQDVCRLRFQPPFDIHCDLPAGHPLPHRCSPMGEWFTGLADYQAGVDIIKTWPANVDAKIVHEIFRQENWGSYYFTLGRNKPKKPIRRLWWTYQGRILGSFQVSRVACNDGSFPRLGRLDDREGGSEFQIRPDHWVAICEDGCLALKERVYFSGFRGWRYFDLDEYRGTAAARMRI